MKSFCLIIISLLAPVFTQAQGKSLLWERDIFEKVTALYSLDETPSVPADTNLIAIWKMDEDADKHNYFVLERYAANKFVFTYMNRGGLNRTYENVGMFFSKIGKADFINIGIYNREAQRAEYFFAKVTDLDSRGWNMTLWLVSDTTLKEIKSREALRARIEKNIDNPAFYAKPVHFQKKLPLMYCK